VFTHGPIRGEKDSLQGGKNTAATSCRAVHHDETQQCYFALRFHLECTRCVFMLD
jgi:hypothetical protein